MNDDFFALLFCWKLPEPYSLLGRATICRGFSGTRLYIAD